MRLRSVTNANFAALATISQIILTLSPFAFHDALLALPSLLLEHETIYTLIKLRIDLTGVVVATDIRGEHSAEETRLTRLGLRVVLLRLLSGLSLQHCPFKLMFHKAGAQRVQIRLKLLSAIFIMICHVCQLISHVGFPDF